VSFYVTTFHDNVPLIRLRQAFEVCGMLTDVYVARYKNMCGQEFGFVRYVNVRNKIKLLKALNNVWLGQNQIVASEARYDRFAHNDLDFAVRGGDVSKGERQDVMVGKQVVRAKGEGVKNVRFEQDVVKTLGDGVNTLAMAEEEKPVIDRGGRFKWSRAEGGVRGRREDQVVLRGEKNDQKDGGNNGKGGSAEESKEGVAPITRMEMSSVEFKQQGNLVSKFIPSYKSCEADLKWAKSGMVATIYTGDSVLALQQRMDEAGFGNVMVKPMGGIKFSFIVMAGRTSGM